MPRTIFCGLSDEKENVPVPSLPILAMAHSYFTLIKTFLTKIVILLASGLLTYHQISVPPLWDKMLITSFRLGWYKIFFSPLPFTDHLSERSRCVLIIILMSFLWGHFPPSVLEWPYFDPSNSWRSQGACQLSSRNNSKSFSPLLNLKMSLHQKSDREARTRKSKLINYVPWWFS